MPKISILHEAPPSPKVNPIKFVYTFNHEMSKRTNVCCSPVCYENIVLIAKDFNNINGKNFDLIFAYNTIKSNGRLYLGHWNDGFVE